MGLHYPEPTSTRVRKLRNHDGGRLGTMGIYDGNLGFTVGLISCDVLILWGVYPNRGVP